MGPIIGYIAIIMPDRLVKYIEQIVSQ